MSNKKEIFSPKVEIINHFDELINRVDIDIDECLEKYLKNENQVLGELDCFKSLKNDRERHEFCYDSTLRLKFFDSSEEKKEESVKLWSESTKVVDYLKLVRMRTVEVLKKEMENCLEYYESNTDKNLEELFENKHCFQLTFRPIDSIFSWFFDLYTVITDFYMTESDIIELE